jgi:hypothetical protein
VPKMSGVGGPSLGAARAEVDGVSPSQATTPRGSLWDLVMRGASFGVPESAAPGGAAPAPGSLGVVCLRISRLLLLGSPGFPPSPIDWRQVEDNAEFTCSQVTAAERLLQETLFSVGQNKLRPIRVSLKMRGKLACAPLTFFIKPSHPLLCLFLQHLSWGSADTSALQAKVTWAWEAAVATEAARIMSVLVVDTFA